MHLPALIGLPWISTPLIFTDRGIYGRFWAGHSNLPCCWVSVGFLGYTHPADHGAVQFSQVASRELALVPTAVQNPVQAANYPRSLMLPDYSPTTTHRSVQTALGQAYGIGLVWHPGHAIPKAERELSQTVKLWLYLSWSFASQWVLLPLWFLKSCSPKGASLDTAPAGCSLWHPPVNIYIWFDIPLRRDPSFSMSCSGTSVLPCRPVSQSSVHCKPIRSHSLSDLMHTDCHSAALAKEVKAAAFKIAFHMFWYLTWVYHYISMRVFAWLIAELKSTHLQFLGCKNVKETVNSNTLYIITMFRPTHFYDSSMTLFQCSKEWDNSIALNKAQMADFT